MRHLSLPKAAAVVLIAAAAIGGVQNAAGAAGIGDMCTVGHWVTPRVETPFSWDGQPLMAHGGQGEADYFYPGGRAIQNFNHSASYIGWFHGQRLVLIFRGYTTGGASFNASRHHFIEWANVTHLHYWYRLGSGRIYSGYYGGGRQTSSGTYTCSSKKLVATSTQNGRSWSWSDNRVSRTP